MSGSKSSKRISVFDRLGPGNDEVKTSYCTSSHNNFVSCYACAVSNYPPSSSLQLRKACKCFKQSGEGKKSRLWSICSLCTCPYGGKGEPSPLKGQEVQVCRVNDLLLIQKM